MDISKLIDWLKLPPQITVTIAIICGAAFFLPDGILTQLSVLAIRDKHQSWLGIAFLVSVSLLITHGSSAGFSWLKKKFKWVRLHRKLKRRLRELTPEEKIILRIYVEQNTRTLYLPLLSGVVCGLIDEHVIYPATSVSYERELRFDCNIQPWAWRYLKKHPKLVGL